MVPEQLEPGVRGPLGPAADVLGVGRANPAPRRGRGPADLAAELEELAAALPQRPVMRRFRVRLRPLP
jgi:hypothetical protein